MAQAEQRRAHQAVDVGAVVEPAIAERNPDNEAEAYEPIMDGCDDEFNEAETYEDSERTSDDSDCVDAAIARALAEDDALPLC